MILVSTDEDRLQATTNEFASAGLKAIAHRCDLSSAEEIERLCDTIEGAHDCLDILVTPASPTAGIKCYSIRMKRGNEP